MNVILRPKAEESFGLSPQDEVSLLRAEKMRFFASAEFILSKAKCSGSE
jgi:hypothetical protein